MTNPQLEIFDGCPNTVTPYCIRNGIGFEWSRKGVGFGQLTLAMREGKFVVDTERMDPEFCAEVIAQAIREAL